MKQLTALIYALLFLVIGISHVWALGIVGSVWRIYDEDGDVTIFLFERDKALTYFNQISKTNTGDVYQSRGDTWSIDDNLVKISFNDGYSTMSLKLSESRDIMTGTWKLNDGSFWQVRGYLEKRNGYVLSEDIGRFKLIKKSSLETIAKQIAMMKKTKTLNTQKKSKVEKSNLSLLKTVYTMLPQEERKKVQSSLKDLGLYKFSVDGFYGKGTASALTEYNKKNLNNADLTKSENVVKLITTVSKLNPSSVGALPNCSGSWSSITWDNCVSTYVWGNGDKYVGAWENGKKSGQGTYTYVNGDKYIGKYKNNKINGQGTYTYVNGDKYVGKNKNDKRNGQGTYTFANGDKYVGEYRNGEYHGQGTYTDANGDKYVGYHKDGKYHGQGTFTYADGDKYVGDWKEGEEHGQGTYTYPDGENYVGEYRDGKYHGQGTYNWSSGNKYVGELQNGKMQGQGTFTYANGNKYVGDFKDGNKHGQGTFTFADGSKWVGAWENNKLNGYAITYYADGSINQEGIFKDNEFLYTQKESKIDKHKDFCEEIGYTPKTEKFADCVLELMRKD